MRPVRVAIVFAAVLVVLGSARGVLAQPCPDQTVLIKYDSTQPQGNQLTVDPPTVKSCLDNNRWSRVTWDLEFVHPDGKDHDVKMENLLWETPGARAPKPRCIDEWSDKVKDTKKKIHPRKGSASCYDEFYDNNTLRVLTLKYTVAVKLDNGWTRLDPKLEIDRGFPLIKKK